MPSSDFLGRDATVAPIVEGGQLNWCQLEKLKPVVPGVWNGGPELFDPTSQTSGNGVPW